jgi:lipoprotein-anchoring transpeptidase ErfK/SrfK
MSAHDRALLEAARQAAKNGQKQQARELLQEAIRQNPGDYRAWLWLAGLSSSLQASLAYVERAEMLKPGDPQVQKARAWVERRLAAAAEGSSDVVDSPAGRAPAAARRPAETAPAEQSRRKGTGASRRRPISWLVAGTVLTVMVLVFAGVALLWSSTTNPALAATLETLARRPALGWLQISTLPEPGASFTGIGDGENSNRYEETALIPVTATQVPAGNTATSADLSAVVTTAMPTATATTSPVATATPVPTATPKNIQPKQVAAIAEVPDSLAPRATWTLTPTPTPTPTATATFAPTATTSAAQAHVARPAGVGLNERWIAVNLTTQTLTAYEGNTAVRSTLISSGLPRTPTVTGQFRIYLRYRSQDMDGYRLGYNYYLRDVPYVQYFYGNYGLHGTYWHNNFGRPMSHGCVNLPTPEAEWLFNWASIGTLVYVHY